MKLMHLSDLHLGKRLDGFNFIETGDQKYILDQILAIADEQHPDCVMIAGDVYDKSVPSAEAVTLFDYFLNELTQRDLTVLVVSGNHDSAERIAFGSQIMKKSNVYLSPVYDGSIKPVVLYDEFDEIRFYLLPFIRPASVREYFPDKQIDNYTSAAAAAVEAMQLNPRIRNILIGHQYVAGADLSDSEEIVGTLESIDASVFSDFDYVALGHIHRPQNVDSEKIRYCGTPLKYSFSEWKHQKSVTIVEIGEKNTPLKISTIPLIPKTDMKEIIGKFDELMQGKPNENYARIILTDEDSIPDAPNRLRKKFPKLMELKYAHEGTITEIDLPEFTLTEQQTPIELFSNFFRSINNREMSDEQKELVEQLITEIWKGETE